jgi:hypothetical protein
VTNSGSKEYSHECGFGVIDAQELCVNATQYSGVTPQITHSSGLVSAGNTLIPVGNSTGVSKTLSVEAEPNVPLEQVLVRICINSGYLDTRASCYNSIEGYIESPNGTLSQFVFANPLGSSVIDSSTLAPVSFDWTFTCYDFYGELGINPQGSTQWTVTLAHPYASSSLYDRNYYQWSSVEITTLSGALLTVPEPASLLLMAGSSLFVVGARKKHR